jgi:histidyl-tRNA synthetase
VHDALGARDAVCGGGRYDGLVEEFGGPPTPALGFAVGVEATLLALSRLGEEWSPPAGGVRAWVAAVKESARPEAFRLLTEVRDAGVAADMDFEGRGLKAQMRKAGRAGASLVLILGPGEVARGTVTLKRMDTGEQEEVPREGVAERLRTPGTDRSS